MRLATTIWLQGDDITSSHSFLCTSPFFFGITLLCTLLLCVFADNGEDNFSVQGRTHSLPRPGTTEGSLDGKPMSCRWREFDKGRFIILQSCEIHS